MKIRNAILILFVIAAAAMAAGCSRSPETADKSDSRAPLFDPSDPALVFDSDPANFGFDERDEAAATVFVTEYKGSSSYIEIPASVTENGKEYSVAGIADNAFMRDPFNKTFEPIYIKLPDGIRTIGKSAFAYLGELRAVSVPLSVEEIGFGAFEGCNKMEWISLPFVGGFRGATYDEKATRETSHFGYIFGAKGWREQESSIPRSLRKIALTDSTSLPAYTFSYCRKVEEIELPDGLLTVGKNALFWCEGLTEITIPETVVSLGISALNGCSHLVEMTLPFAGISSDGSYGNIGFAFGAESAQNNARYMPNTLRKVTITKQKKIKSEAFKGLSLLSTIILPDDVAEIGDGAFDGCTSLGFNSFGGVGYIGGKTKPYLIAMNAENKKEVDAVNLADTCIAVEAYAFSCCSELAAAIIPEGVTKIGTGAFYRCPKLVSAAIPSTVTAIGESAFYRDENLENVEIAAASKLSSIGKFAFAGCKKLKRFRLPSSLNKIGGSAFLDCKGLKEVEIESLAAYLRVTLENEFSSPFFAAEKLVVAGNATEKIEIPAQTTEIKPYAFCGLKSVNAVSVPASVTLIGYAAFKGMVGLTEIEIPFVGRAVADNQNECFAYVFGCDYYADGNKFVPASLSVVRIIGGTKIKSNTFFGLTGIKEIHIPATVVEIGESAFYGCSLLDALVYGGSTTDFAAVNKGANWSFGTLLTAAHCNDGDAEL